MSTLQVRDPYGNVFEIDATARAFWERREGHEILPAAEPEPAPAVEPPADESGKAGAPKSMQRAARAAQEVKEQPSG